MEGILSKMSSPERLGDQLEVLEEHRIADFLLPTTPRGDRVRATVADSQDLPFDDRVSILTYRLWSEKPKELAARLGGMFGSDLNVVGISLENKALEERLDRCGRELLPGYSKFHIDLKRALVPPHKSKAS